MAEAASKFVGKGYTKKFKKPASPINKKIHQAIPQKKAKKGK